MKHLFIFQKDSLLLTSRNRIPTGEWTQWLTEEPKETVALPVSTDGTANAATEVEQTQGTVNDAKWISLRESFYVLPAADFRMAAKAHELLHWHRASRFCGFCGNPTEWSTEISKRCPKCHREIWANVQPAMIVAITRNNGEELLLVQSKNFKRDYLGLVAGFVETGENLEDCVEREIKEETGLTVKNLKYFASQSWPFPNVLMVGFTAEYAGGELTLQRSELNKGGWFRRDNLPAIPGKVSLARKLIDHWLEQKKTTHE